MYWTLSACELKTSLTVVSEATVYIKVMANLTKFISTTLAEVLKMGMTFMTNG